MTDLLIRGGTVVTAAGSRRAEIADAGEQGIAMNRLRQLVLFERLLARIYEACGDAVIVKGGFVLELRLAGAR